MAKCNPISVRLEPEVMAALRRVAKTEGLKVAAAAARAITMAMQQAMQAELSAVLEVKMAKEKRTK